MTPAQIIEACNVTQTMTGDPLAKACNAVTATGGAWQVWCLPGTGQYVWVRWEGLLEPNPMTCQVLWDGAVYDVVRPGMLEWYDYEYAISAFGGGGGGWLSAPVILGSTGSTAGEEGFFLPMWVAGAKGHLTVWAVRSQEKCSGGPADETAVLGAAIEWDMP